VSPACAVSSPAGCCPSAPSPPSRRPPRPRRDPDRLPPRRRLNLLRGCLGSRSSVAWPSAAPMCSPPAGDGAACCPASSRCAGPSASAAVRSRWLSLGCSLFKGSLVGYVGEGDRSGRCGLVPPAFIRFGIGGLPDACSPLAFAGGPLDDLGEFGLGRLRVRATG